MNVPFDSTLPEASTPDAFVKVSPFNTGSMVAPMNITIQDARGDGVCGSWRFFITHQATKTKFWFDLGISHDLSHYPPSIQNIQHKFFETQPAPNSILDDMKLLGEDPNSVKYVIASHAHWDHMFPVKEFLPNAKILCGTGTLALTERNWPKYEDGKWDGRIWDPEASELPIEELPSPKQHPDLWKPLAGFERTYDFFGDGSFFIIDAPGHLDGNLAALCRTKSKQGETRWVVLVADCMHCLHFAYYPEAPFGNAVTFTKNHTLHEDPESARAIIRQMANLKSKDPRVYMWLSHVDILEGVWDIE